MHFRKYCSENTQSHVDKTVYGLFSPDIPLMHPSSLFCNIYIYIYNIPTLNMT